MTDRSLRLLEIMRTYGLRCVDVAQILDRQPQTIRVWRSKYTDRVIPADALKLLELKTKSLPKKNATKGKS